jgi:hypothetical protein
LCGLGPPGYRSSQCRTPFLKKRSMSRVFDGVDVRFVLALMGGVLVWGRA